MTGSLLVIALCGGAGLVVGRLLQPLVAAFDAPVTVRFPLVETVTAALYALAGWALGGSWRVLPMLVALAGLVAISIVDFSRYRIPNRILFPTLVVSVAMIVLGEIVAGNSASLGHALVGAGVFTGFLFFMHLINPGGLGFGDVKLAVLLGFLIGWLAESATDAVSWVMVALFIGSIVGVVMGLGLYLLRRTGKTVLEDPDEPARLSTFPFGPLLAAGAVFVVLVI